MNKWKWEVRYESDLLKVEVQSVHDSDDYWIVHDKTTGKQRKFRGESAWSDAQRLASDIDFMSVVV